MQDERIYHAPGIGMILACAWNVSEYILTVARAIVARAIVASAITARAITAKAIVASATKPGGRSPFDA